MPYTLSANTRVSGPLSSTCFSSYSYDPRSGLLNLTFRDSGHTYPYSPVSKSLFEEFMSSPSKGRFFNARIKWIYG